MRDRLISFENLELKCWKLEVVLDSPRSVWVACVIIYALNCGLGVVGSEMAMDFGSTKWNRCLVRELPTDNPQFGLGTVKNSPGLLDWIENVHGLFA